MEENKKASVVDFNVTSEVKFRPGGKKHYGKVKMSADAYFLFTGDFQLEIDELENKKNEFSKSRYEFLIQTPDGENGSPGECGKDAAGGAVSIIIHKLLNDVHIKSLGGNGGNGGDGIDGGEGGNGGNAAASGTGKGTGGTGGNGGDGGDGGNGGNGASGPEIAVTYTKDENHAEVIVLSEDNAPCDENISYGGKGGKGGKSGQGGMGGTGGLNGDSQTRAPSGTSGSSGNSGKDGIDGMNVTIKFILSAN